MKNHEEKPLGKLEILLDNYLTRRTNYAMLLTGGWGAGKTHYIKNTFLKKMEGTGYKAILISLYGVNSVEDIKQKIYNELHPILTHKNSNIAVAMVKGLLKSADVTKLFGEGVLAQMVDEVSEFAGEIKKSKVDNINFEKLVICFDDLERVKPELLSGNEILGYINSLVENANIKIIIIANESKIESAEFKVVKEKTIGHTISFQQNAEEVFESILKEAETTDAFVEFLRDNRKKILRFFALQDDTSLDHINFRTLQYFVSFFGDIFHFVRNELKIKALESKKDEILDYLFSFSIMVCNEYKKGTIDYSNSLGLQNGNDFALKQFYEQELGEKPKDLNDGEKIIVRYELDSSYKFLPSVYNYLTGGDYFDKEKLETEIRGVYHVVDQKISDAYKVLNELSSASHPELSDQQNVLLTRQLRDFALKSEYLAEDYLRVLYYILRKGNILNLKAEKLVAKLMLAVKKLQPVHRFNPSMERLTMIPRESEIFDVMQPLRAAIIELNRNGLKLDAAGAAKEIQKLLSTDFEQLYQKLVDSIDVPDNRLSMAEVSPAVFFRVFNNASNVRKALMIRFLRILYDRSYGNSGIGDHDFLTNLGELLKTKVEGKIHKNNSGALLQELYAEVTTKIIPEINWRNSAY